MRSSHRGASPAELGDGIQDGGAERLRGADRGSLEKLFDAVQAEFLAGQFAAALALDHSARNQQQSGTFLQADGGSFGSGVGKQSQRKTGRTEFGDPAAVAEKSGRVSGIGVAERAEFLVVAGDEGRAGADAAGRFRSGRD